MRKSFAPSQCSSSKHAASQFKSPLQAKRPRVLQENTANNSIVRRPTAEHEEIIANILKRPFKIPIPNYVPDFYNSRCLGIKRTTLRRPLYDPTACNALVLYTPPDYSEHKKIINNNEILVHVVVDPIVTNVLRPHQREGVKFMYDCVTGARGDFHGCIMADEMGLGKTLQCVTLVWTLLQQGPDCKPAIRNCIIVSPSSLVKNWQKEFDKWLYGRLNCLVMDKGTKDEITKNLEQFISSRNQRGGVPILIISYESFRLYANILNKSEIGLVICDEGHRLKNNDNLTYQALMCLKTKKRILLSGTPIQNDLTEYYSLVNFVNPGMLGTKNEFGRRFELPILRGQNADCTDKDKALASERTAELLNIVNQCIIRRTNQINTKYLPVKFEMVICVKMTPFQEDLYKKFIKSDAIRLSLISNTDKKGSLSTLADITCLKKLCNHPNLVYDKIINKESGFNNVGNLPANYNPKELNPEFGGKVMLLDYMLASIKANTDDKVVLISNYTQTLDLFEQLCRKRKYTYVRLDGSMTIKKRSKIVDEFNDADSNVYIFMLSSKAGGCGLNLIGGNRLFMFDPDWNPANDEQAMARVWRDGQKKTCYTYRFVMTGTIEEKIFQRQTHKKSLSSVIVDNEDTGRYFTRDDLKDLFLYEENTISDTHQKFKCNRCMNGIQIKEPDESTDNTSHLSHWYHCSNNKGLPDTILSQSWSQSKTISFVFHHRSKGVKTS